MRLVKAAVVCPECPVDCHLCLVSVWSVSLSE